MEFLTRFIPGLTPAKLIAGGVLALALAVYVAVTQITLANRATKIATLNGQITLLQAVNDENARVVGQLKADTVRAEEAVRNVQAQVVERVKTHTIVKREIVRVAAESPAKCPLPDSLEYALDRLRERAAAGR